MRKAIVLIITVLVLGLAAAMTVGQFLNVAQRIAHVSEVVGLVTVKTPTGADFFPLKGAANVLAGSVIRTAPGASVSLSYVDGTRLRIGSEALLTVLKCQLNRATGAETSLFRLDMGEVAVRVRKLLSGESKFEISTPTATAGVRGTRFTLAVNPQGDTTLAVTEGEVALQSAGGLVAVKPGQTATVTGGQVQVAASAPGTAERSSLLMPYLRVIAPTEGAQVAPGTLVVRGQAEESARVLVNGQEATRSGAWFTARVVVPAGVESFTVTAEAQGSGGEPEAVTRQSRTVTVGTATE